MRQRGVTFRVGRGRKCWGKGWNSHQWMQRSGYTSWGPNHKGDVRYGGNRHLMDRTKSKVYQGEILGWKCGHRKT